MRMRLTSRTRSQSLSFSCMCGTCMSLVWSNSPPAATIAYERMPMTSPPASSPRNRAQRPSARDRLVAGRGAAVEHSHCACLCFLGKFLKIILLGRSAGPFIFLSGRAVSSLRNMAKHGALRVFLNHMHTSRKILLVCIYRGTVEYRRMDQTNYQESAMTATGKAMQQG